MTTLINGKCKQWEVALASTLEMEAMIAAIKEGQPIDLEGYKLTNPGPDGKRRFYMAENGQYGQPLLLIEPDLAMDVPTGMTYVSSRGDEVKPTEKIGGFIVNELDGSVSYRYSLSNAKDKKVSFGFEPDGSFLVDGKVYWLNTLFSKDKNRCINYDGFFSPTKTMRVSMVEMADLRFGVKAA